MSASTDHDDTKLYSQIDLETRERRRAQNRLAQRKRRIFDAHSSKQSKTQELEPTQLGDLCSSSMANQTIHVARNTANIDNDSQVYEAAQKPHRQAPFTQHQLDLGPQHPHLLFQQHEYGSTESIFQLDEFPDDYGPETWEELGPVSTPPQYPVAIRASGVGEASKLQLNQAIDGTTCLRQDLGIKIDSNPPGHHNMVSSSQLPTDDQEMNAIIILPAVNQGTLEENFGLPKDFPRNFEYSQISNCFLHSNNTVEYTQRDLARIAANIQSHTPAQTDSDGKTTLHLAAENGHISIVRCLLHFGAAIDVLDNSGSTALHGAIKNGRTNIVAALLSKGADINAIDRAGWTPLHMAAMNGHEEIIRLLIQSGVDLNAKINGSNSS